MKASLNFLWKWSWVITLPIVCVALYWGGLTAERFYTFGIRYNPAPPKFNLHNTGVEEFYSLYTKTELALSSLWKNNNKEAEGLKAINLFVPESSLAELNSNLPHSGYEYVEGSLLNGDNLQKVRVKYRGDFFYHWAGQRKSLRVKTRKSELYDGLRTFNLLAAKQLRTHFGCLLAKDMGLIAPRTDLVEVTLNGKLLGVHAFVEQLGETTLRNNRRMPGDLYAGELIGKDAYWGINNRIFDHPRLWKKKAVNNHYDKESRKPLEKLLSLLNNLNSEQAQRELTELLDLKAWGLMAAFETLTQSFHYDAVHNWRLYYDPMKSRFYPVIWDPMGWTPRWLPKEGEEAQMDIMPSVMHQLLFKNADILKARAQALRDFFRDDNDKAFLQQVEQVLPGLKAAAKRDPLRNWPLDEEIAWIEAFPERIRRVFSDIKRVYLENREPLNYSFIGEDPTDFRMAVSVSGRVPVNTLSLTFENTFDGPITGTITYYMNGEKIEKDISGAISLSDSSITIRKTLISSHQKISVGDSSETKNRLKIEPAYYELTLNGLSPANRMIGLQVDYGDGQMVPAEQVSGLENASFVELYNIVNAQPLEEPIVWQGVVDIYTVKEIGRPLIIEPGTIVRLSPGASLILKNHLLAKGTADHPISFVPMFNEQKPWGTLTIMGSKANGSQLKYCKFEGGSGLKGDLFEYTAMFSIHDVKGVVVENCRFRDSKITDDMVHAVYSEVRFSDCLFERSLMDALDIDISTATVDNCFFIDSGNDALDLMDSKVTVVDTVLENSGDKGISIGEGSRLFAVNSRLESNAIGVQVKDGSVASLNNLDFIKNKLALGAYKKNWRYNGGGHVFAHKSHFKDNVEALTADKSSTIRVSDSFFSILPELKKKRIRLDATVDMSDERRAKINVVNHYPKEASISQGFKPEHLKRIDPTRRGAVNLGQH